MSRFLEPRWALGLVLALSVGLSSAPAQEQKDRLLIHLKHAAAADLAKVLTQHMKSDNVQVIAEPVSNSLFVNAPTAAINEIRDLVQQLDLAPPPAAVVVVEVIIADVVPGKDGAAEVNERDFNGPTDAVMKKVEALRKEGRLGTVKRLQNATVEGQQNRVLVGEMKPYVTGSSSTRPGGFGGGGGGGTMSILNYRDIGTTVTVTPKVNPDKTASLDLKIEDTRMSQPEDGPQVGTTDKGTAITATEFVTSQVTTKVNVPLGEAVMVSGVKTMGKAKNAQTLVIVSARLAGSEGKKNN